MNLAKYEFDNKEQFKSKIESLVDIKFDVIELGHIMLSNPVFEGDDIIQDATFHSKYLVDMIWYGLEDHPYGWKSYSVNITSNGSNSIAGLNYNDYTFK